MSMAIVGTIRAKRTRTFTIHYEDRLVEMTLPSVAPISEIFSMLELKEKLPSKIDPTRHTLFFLDTKSSGASRQSCGDNLAVQISHIPSDVRDLYIEKLGPRHRVFGARVSEISGWIEDAQFLPDFFSRIARFFEEDRNRKAVGIFRILPDRRSVEKYCKMFEVGDVFEFPRDENPHIVSGVLLKFLTDLSPPGLIPSKRTFLNGDISALDSKFIQQQVPERELRILGFIVGLCCKVANFSAVNKMTPRNLAAVFAPIIFKDMDDDLSMEYFSKMIEDFDIVFPQSIRDHLARVLPRTPRSPKNRGGIVERRTEVVPKQEENSSPSNSVGSSSKRPALDIVSMTNGDLAPLQLPTPVSPPLAPSRSMVSSPVSSRIQASTPLSTLGSARLQTSPLQSQLTEKDNEITRLRSDLESRDKIINALLQRIEELEKKQIAEKQALQQKDSETSVDDGSESVLSTSRRYSVSSEISDFFDADAIIEHSSDEKVDRRTITISPRFRKSPRNNAPPNPDSSQQEPIAQDTDTAKKRRSRMLNSDSIVVPDRLASEDLTMSPISSEHQCQSCKCAITGDWIEANGKQFHRSCFKCGACGEAIKGAFSLKATESSPLCRACMASAVKNEVNKEAVKKKEPVASTSSSTVPATSSTPPQSLRGHEKICMSCQEPIPKGERINALGKNWHVRCFVCQRCGAQFPEWKFFAHADQPVCASCKKFLL